MGGERGNGVKNSRSSHACTEKEDLGNLPISGALGRSRHENNAVFVFQRLEHLNCFCQTFQGTRSGQAAVDAMLSSKLQLALLVVASLLGCSAAQGVEGPNPFLRWSGPSPTQVAPQVPEAGAATSPAPTAELQVWPPCSLCHSSWGPAMGSRSPPSPPSQGAC